MRGLLARNQAEKSGSICKSILSIRKGWEHARARGKMQTTAARLTPLRSNEFKRGTLIVRKPRRARKTARERA
jgi:hypothetical protein